MKRRLLRPAWRLLVGATGPVGVFILPAAALALIGTLMLLLARLALA